MMLSSMLSRRLNMLTRGANERQCCERKHGWEPKADRFSFLRMSIAGLTALGLIGCATAPLQTSDVNPTGDLGNVYVSAYPDVPWSEISSKLAPQNHLSMDEARKLATVTTQAQVSQVASIFAAGLGIGLKTSNQPGSSPVVPSSSGMPSTSLPSLSSDLTKGLPNFQVDGNTYINEATALYQQAQILDNEFTMGYVPKDYSVHLITLQVNVQPKRRDESDDVYVNVNFLPEMSKDKDHDNDWMEVGEYKPIIIYPLIISDAMELTSVGKSLQVIKQAEFQLSGLIGIAGVNGQFSSALNRLNTLIGYEKNSLVTVGRINTNMIRIRFGAENSGLSQSGLALVPRVYNVSLAVMVPKAVSSLQVISHASFISTKDGRTPSTVRTHRDLVKQVKKKMDIYNYSLTKNICKKDKNDEKNHESVYLNILRDVDWQDYDEVAGSIAKKDTRTWLQQVLGTHRCSSQRSIRSVLKANNLNDEIKFSRFLSSMAEIQIDSLYSDFRIPLEILQTRLPKNNSLALLTDNPKGSAVVVLPGGSGLDQSKIRAYLTVDTTCNGNEGVTLHPIDIHNKCVQLNGENLYAEKVAYASDTGLTMSFPSLLGNGLELDNNANRGCDNDSDKDCEGALHILLYKGAKKTSSSAYEVAQISAPEQQPSPSPVIVLSKTIVADKTGSGTVDVAANYTDSSMQPVLMVSGADISSVSDLTNPTSSVPIGGKGISLSTGQMYAIHLSDLAAGDDVTLKVTDAASGKAYAKISPLSVVYSPRVKKKKE